MREVDDKSWADVHERLILAGQEMAQAKDRIAELERQLEKAKTLLAKRHQRHAFALKGRTHAEAYAARLRGALNKYGKHDPYCSISWRPCCDCGLEKALADDGRLENPDA